MVFGSVFYKNIRGTARKHNYPDLDSFVCFMATISGQFKIAAPNFTKIFLDAIKGAAISAFHRLPYSDTDYYKWGLYSIGALFILLFILWYWKNFLR